jgi:hypothetical protein
VEAEVTVTYVDSTLQVTDPKPLTLNPKSETLIPKP